MAQGRKAKPAADLTPVVEVNHEALDTANQALTVMSQEALAIQAQFGLESLDPATLEAEIGIWVEHASRAMYMVGSRLLALRTLSPRGEWLERLQRLGIGERMAQRIMSATIKCVGSDNKPREKLLSLTRTKVLELVALDDDQLDVLEQGGTLASGLDLDAIDRMPASELKARLRECKQEVEAKQTLIEAKNAENDQLKETLARPWKPTEGEAAQTAEEQALLNGIRDCVTQIESAVMKIIPMADRAMDGTLSAPAAAQGRQSIEYVAQRIADIFLTTGITVDFEQLIVPAWLDKSKAKPKAKKAA